MINEIRMRHWPGKWQAHTHTHRKQKRVTAWVQRTPERESESNRNSNKWSSCYRCCARVSYATKNACLPFLFCGMFFSLIFLFILSTLWILILFFATFARCNCFLSFAIFPMHTGQQHFWTEAQTRFLHFWKLKTALKRAASVANQT